MARVTPERELLRRCPNLPRGTKLELSVDPSNAMKLRVKVVFKGRWMVAWFAPLPESADAIVEWLGRTYP